MRISLPYQSALLVALGLGGLGQWLLGDPPQSRYAFSVPQPIHFAGGLLLLTSGAALFGVAVRRHRSSIPEHQIGSTSSAPSQCSAWARGLTWLAGVLAAAILGWVVAGLASGNYRPLFGWLCLGSFLFAAIAFATHDRASGVRWWRPLNWWEVGFLILVPAAFIGLNSFDLTHWYYSAIGDEYVFFSEARRIAYAGPFNPFSVTGVYGYHPVLSSAYQALVMKVFGIDHFGWKLSSVLAVAISFPFFYLLVSGLWGRRTGLLATAVLASSHLLFGYAHTGYNNVQALPISLAAFWLFFAGQQRRSSLLLFLAAATAGLGFYTIFIGRAAAIILTVYTLLVYRGRPPRWLLVPTLTGAALTIAPLFAANGLDVIGQMADQSAFTYIPPSMDYGAVERLFGDSTFRLTFNVMRMLVWNAPINLIAFNYNVQPHHYVTGSLFDPASAVLATLGVGALLARIRSQKALFVVVWWCVGFLVTAVLNIHLYVSPSRIHYLAPCYALAAGLALNYLLSAFGFSHIRRLYRWAMLGVISVGIFTLILGLNLHRFWVESPPRTFVSTSAVAVRAVRSPPCTEGSGVPVVVGDSLFQLESVFMSYGDHPKPLLLSQEALRLRYDQVIVTAPCIVLLPPLEPIKSELSTALKGTNPVWRTEVVTDYSGTRQAMIFFPQRP